MIEFDIWWNSADADAFRAKNEDMDGEQVRPVWDAAVRAVQAPAPAQRGPLKRGSTGVCSRSLGCQCERDGLGDECVWLAPIKAASVHPTDAELERKTGEPHVDGYPLYSGLPSPAPAPAPEAQRDGWNEPHNCIAAGPTATDVALWRAMNEAAKVGNRDDDKLIRKALNDAGYYLVRSLKKPGTCEHLLAAQCAAVQDGWHPIETAPKDRAWILVWRSHATRALIVRYDAAYDAFENEAGEHVYHLTHWMQLPPAPDSYVPVQGSEL